MVKQRIRGRRLFAPLSLATLLASLSLAGAQTSEGLVGEALIHRGKALFASHCAGCHGSQGGGEGPGAYGLNPKPRDLTSGVFKFRSTPSGKLPTESDVADVIRNGIPGSSMPGFPLMADRDIDSLVQFVKTLSPKWTDPSNYAEPIPIPPEPLDFQQTDQRRIRAARGAKLFATTCAACHGPEGKGDGPTANTLFDQWGNPVRPKNLSYPFVGAGTELQDVYQSITTGIDGTPMISYAGLYDDSQRWDLVAYIAFLREQRKNPSLILPNLDNVPTSTESSETESNNTNEAATDPSIYE